MPDHEDEENNDGVTGATSVSVISARHLYLFFLSSTWAGCLHIGAGVRLCRHPYPLHTIAG